MSAFVADLASGGSRRSPRSIRTRTIHDAFETLQKMRLLAKNLASLMRLPCLGVTSRYLLTALRESAAGLLSRRLDGRIEKSPLIPTFFLRSP